MKKIWKNGNALTIVRETDANIDPDDIFGEDDFSICCPINERHPLFYNTNMRDTNELFDYLFCEKCGDIKEVNCIFGNSLNVHGHEFDYNGEHFVVTKDSKHYYNSKDENVLFDLDSAITAFKITLLITAFRDDYLSEDEQMDILCNTKWNKLTVVPLSAYIHSGITLYPNDFNYYLYGFAWSESLSEEQLSELIKEDFNDFLAGNYTEYSYNTWYLKDGKLEHENYYSVEKVGEWDLRDDFDDEVDEISDELFDALKNKITKESLITTLQLCSFLI